jgi:hypothetical protein
VNIFWKRVIWWVIVTSIQSIWSIHQ